MRLHCVVCGIRLVVHEGLYQLVHCGIVVTPIGQAGPLSLHAKPYVDNVAGQMANPVTLLECYLSPDPDKEIMSQAAAFDRECSQFPTKPLITDVDGCIGWIAALL